MWDFEQLTQCHGIKDTEDSSLEGCGLASSTSLTMRASEWFLRSILLLLLLSIVNILVRVGMEAPVLPLSDSHQDTCYCYCCPISKRDEAGELARHDQL